MGRATLPAPTAAHDRCSRVGLRSTGLARPVHAVLAMRRIAAIALCLLATGCGSRIVITIPHFPSFGNAPARRPGAECRYLNVLVDYSTQASGMSGEDVRLSAEVAEAMRQEFERLGARVTDEPGQAYWSLMLMAVHNKRDGGFIFSAMLALRELDESRDRGIARYARSDDPEDAPTMYTGVSYGALEDVERLARQYVQKADAALLPSARKLCAFEAEEGQRHSELEREVPHPERPL